MVDKLTRGTLRTAEPGSYWVVQLAEQFGSEAEADEALRALSLQVDFLAGRTYSGAGKYGQGSWLLQAFFESPDAPRGGWLPHGLRWVLLIPSMVRALQEGRGWRAFDRM